MRPVRVLWLAAVLLAFGPPAAQAATYHLGVEVGSSGVKAVLVDLDDPELKPIKPMEKTTSLAASVVEADGKKGFNPKVVKETAAAAAALVDEYKKAYPDLKAVRVAVSSGVAAAVGGNPEALDALAADLKDAVPMADRVDRITAADEVRLTLLQAALRQKKNPAEVLLVDIGSGNIKFGYVDPAGGKWAVSAAELPQGTKLFAAQVGKEPELDGKTGDERVKAYAAAAKRLTADRVVKPIRAAFETGLPAAGKRATVYLTGGAPAFLVRSVKPAEAKADTVPLTGKDVDKYFDMASGNVSDELRKVFSFEQSAVGAQLVAAVFEGLNKTDGGQLVFLNNSQFFWITQLVTEQGGKNVPAVPATTGAAAKPNGIEIKGNDTLQTDPEVAKLLQEILKKMPAEPVEKKDIRDIADAIRRLSEKPGTVAAPTPPPGTQPVAVPARPTAPGTPFDPDAGWKLFYRGRELYDAGKHADAATFFTTALRAADYEVPFWFGLALAESAAGKEAAAKAAAGRVAELLYARADLAADSAQYFERVQGAVRQTVEGYVRDATDRLRLASVR